MNKFETLEKIRRILFNVGDKMLLLTSGNLPHNLAIHRATIHNVRQYLIPKAMNMANDVKTKRILTIINYDLGKIDEQMVRVLNNTPFFTKLQAVNLKMALGTSAHLLDKCIKTKDS